MCNPRQFPSSHRMAAKEERTFFASEKFRSSLGNANFRAASVGDQRVRGSVTRNFRKKIDGRRDRKRQVNQIRVLQSWRQIATERFVERTATLRFANDVGAIPAGNVHSSGVLAERERE